MNTVVRIKDENVEWIEKEKLIIKSFGEYYQKLFQSVGARDWGNVLTYVSRLGTEVMNDSLVKDIEKDDIKKGCFPVGNI